MRGLKNSFNSNSYEPPLIFFLYMSFVLAIIHVVFTSVCLLWLVVKEFVTCSSCFHRDVELTNGAYTLEVSCQHTLLARLGHRTRHLRLWNNRNIKSRSSVSRGLNRRLMKGLLNNIS